MEYSRIETHLRCIYLTVPPSALHLRITTFINSFLIDGGLKKSKTGVELCI